MRDLQAIQADINMMDQAIQGGGSIDNLETWKVEKEKYEREFVEATAYWDGKQAHEGRVQDATAEITTYFDTLYVGGKSVREMCSDEEAYQILKLSVSQAFIDQATKNSEVLSKAQADSQAAIKQEKERADELDNQNGILLQEKHALKTDLDDITSRFKAVELLLSEAPSSEETDKLKQTVKELTAQLELKNKADEPIGDVKSQIDAMIQERENKKVKITNLRLADPSGINTKDYLATDVLTGLQINIHSNYVKSYKEVSAEEAEQIRAAEANKKAELEQQQAAIPTLEVPEIEPVHAVLEEEATTGEQTFPESDQVDATESRLADQSQTETGESTEESEVITLESLNNRVKSLENRMYTLYNGEEVA